MGKTIFILHPHSFVDVITNSSSELFVGEALSKDNFIEFINLLYPDYLNEYKPPKGIDDLTVDELDLFIGYATLPSSWPAKKSDYPILPGFTFDELYKPNDVNWIEEVQYKLKRNDDFYFVTKENIKEIKNKLDPNRQMYFLFSLDDNPTWEYQEVLEKYLTRYHLG